MTTGGKAAAKDGGRAGYGLLKQLNHTCTKLFPTLCPVPVKSGALRSLKGQRCMCSVTLKNGGHALAREQGELQFTENALSGICVFQLSRQCAQLLDQGEAPILCADLLPDISYQELFGELSHRIKEGKLQAEELLTGILNKRIALSALKESGAAPLNRCAAEIKKRELKRLCQILKGWEFEAASPARSSRRRPLRGESHAVRWISIQWPQEKKTACFSRASCSTWTEYAAAITCTGRGRPELSLENTPLGICKRMITNDTDNRYKASARLRR